MSKRKSSMFTTVAGFASSESVRLDVRSVRDVGEVVLGCVDPRAMGSGSQSGMEFTLNLT
jgi:hypothetical protein